MNELKAYTYDDMLDGVANVDIEYYPKSEADKAIAELEERIADGDRDFEIVNHQNEKLLKIVCKHKYKRCLAMARWCWAIKELNRYGDQDYMDFAEKWRKRWIKLADKLKEAK